MPKLLLPCLYAFLACLGFCVLFRIRGPGAVLCALVMGDISPTAPGVLLATMLCTGLSPIAGQFGWYWGVAAGFLHMAIVQHTSFLHGGMNLYNNGFAAGLTCILVIPVIEALKKEPEE